MALRCPLSCNDQLPSLKQQWGQKFQPSNLAENIKEVKHKSTLDKDYYLKLTFHVLTELYICFLAFKYLKLLFKQTIFLYSNSHKKHKGVENGKMVAGWKKQTTSWICVGIQTHLFSLSKPSHLQEKVSPERIEAWTILLVALSPKPRRVPDTNRCTINAC